MPYPAKRIDPIRVNDVRKDWVANVRRKRLDIRMWVIDRVPVPFLTQAHELAISVVLLVLAVPAILGLLPGQRDAGVPDWAWRSWAATMIVSATFTWWGLLRNRPRVEWIGQLAAGWGLALFSFRLATLGLEYTYPTVLTFLTLATVSWWRAFKITSVALVQHRLTAAAREAHRRVYGRERVS